MSVSENTAAPNVMEVEWRFVLLRRKFSSNTKPAETETEKKHQ